MEIIYNIENINEVAKQLIANVTTKTLLVYGDMGVGKTTLIKAIVKLLGSHDDVSSPTFSIVNEYEANNTLIYHFDLYRIKDVEELYNVGIEDYLFSDNWSIIEWPEKIENIVETPYDRIDLVLNPDNSRTLKLKNKNEFNLINMQSGNI
ncbi:tRNA (adenosine(37)-N6)-threonylcarbamoyltransferase complex ATPase subunit type 1 TsaE [Confluentibacter flavum]|uniref:tRNA threonylcarbamoyladenosine biosynthesis protein TsaE n=1 Tax=Confluentibacter flavum TaxID=1909700 RepID=A0A2N3HGR1_9FLAO|nr:tRNA (adenosine(37)-N6)-threonylcarbamoyltransferase complex ATPase subunit type 1 TsaE [Confluentibacter flavum]PKQ44151.1 tRNA (adenosine(37)-N6)-threonylcarbamoyltransferase complex ATPase subunit type 1 TsaE [Confluentibacter flavum]